MMLSRIIEVKELFDKKLLYDVQIEAVFYEIFGKTIKTDKWLGFADWQQIYEKLDSILSASVSPNLDDLSLDGFRVSNSISVEIEKCPLKKAYWRLFSLTEREVLPFVLSIKVSRLGFVELTKQLEELKSYRKHGSCQKTKRCQIELRRDIFPEYSPLPVSPRDNSKIPTYKPYKPSAKGDAFPSVKEEQHDSNEYCPKPINNSQKPGSEEPSKSCYNPSTNNSGKKTVPTYIPSEIPKVSPSNADEEVVTSSPTGVASTEDLCNPSRVIAKHSRTLRQRTVSNGASNKPQSELLIQQEHKNKKRKHPEESEGGKVRYRQELFGSDDSDRETRKKEFKLFELGETQDDVKKSKEIGEEKAYLKNDRHDEKSKKYRTGKNLEDLKSKRSKRDDDRSSNSEIKKKSKSSKAVKNEPYSLKPKLSEEEQKRLREAHLKDMEALDACNVKLEALTRSPSPVKILKLNHMRTDDILNTFNQHIPMLDMYFKQFKEQKGHKVRKMHDLNPLMTINIVDEQKSLAMLNHLKEIYETDTENVPCYTDLFMELMLPEWILAIFMKEYNMPRADAIKHIKVQNQLDDSQG